MFVGILLSHNMFVKKSIPGYNRRHEIIFLVYNDGENIRREKLSARTAEWKGWSLKILLVFGYSPSSGRHISSSTEEKLKNRRPFSHLASRFHYTASTRLVVPLFTHLKLRGPAGSKSYCQVDDELWRPRKGLLIARVFATFANARNAIRASQLWKWRSDNCTRKLTLRVTYRTVFSGTLHLSSATLCPGGLTLEYSVFV